MTLPRSFDPTIDSFAVVGFGPRPGGAQSAETERARARVGAIFALAAGADCAPCDGVYKGCPVEPGIILAGPDALRAAGLLGAAFGQESALYCVDGAGFLLYCDTGKLESIGPVHPGEGSGDFTRWDGGAFHVRAGE